MARVTLYRDPRDMEGPDEEVELVRRVVVHRSAHYYRLEEWIVKFDDGYEAQRFIHQSQIPEDMQVTREE